MDNIDGVAEGVRQLRIGDTEVTQLLEGAVSVDLRVHVRADATDVAHFVKDGTQLRREEQKGQT
jgi:hypothetical protein